MIYSKIEGEGQPMLIIHGFLGMSDNWKTLGAQFAKLGYEVHMLDMRNHGRSFHSSNFSYQDMSTDVWEYCQAHQLKDVILLGHSMGGKIAMFFASQYPDIVSQLIVVDIAPKHYAPHHQDVMQALNAVTFYEGMNRKEVEDIISQYVTDAGTVQFLMKNVHRVTPTLLGYRFNLEVFNANEHSIGEELPSTATYSKNTLFIRGGNSDYILDSDFEAIKNHFPKAIIETIAGAGHWVHADKPNELLEKFSTFINS
ncbi:MAG TPA: alpha/beta fold hydrolase [Flavobacterium sp.]|nr:alpha/beta fold hydrolase [Flavobacterium sp.]